MAASFIFGGHPLGIASGRRPDWALRAGSQVLGMEPFMGAVVYAPFGRTSGLGISRARSLTYLDSTHSGTAGGKTFASDIRGGRSEG